MTLKLNQMAFCILLIFGTKSFAESCDDKLLLNGNPSEMVEQLVEQQFLRLQVEDQIKLDTQSVESVDESIEKYEMVEAADELADHITDAEIFILLGKKFAARKGLESEISLLTNKMVEYASVQLTGTKSEARVAQRKEQKVEDQVALINRKIREINFDIATLPAPQLGKTLSEVIKAKALRKFHEYQMVNQSQGVLSEMQQNETLQQMLKRTGPGMYQSGILNGQEVQTQKPTVNDLQPSTGPDRNKKLH
jgi:hypothetical protein